MPASAPPTTQGENAAGGATAAPAQRTVTPTPTPAKAANRAGFAAGFAKVRPRLSGPASVALMSAGGERVSAGDLDTGVAWSTSKVPLAIAALRASDWAANCRDVRAAIRASDNPAAERL